MEQATTILRFDAASTSDVTYILDHFKNVRVLVIGDIMLDVYRIGDAVRISPEAPVPVLLNPSTEFRLGGAGAVAAMCSALGAKVRILGLLGDDAQGREARRLLVESGVQFVGAMTSQRVTTTKERICGVASGRHRQQLIRVDAEEVSPISSELSELLVAEILKMQGDPPDVILVSDYAKGICETAVLDAASQLDVPALVDPPKHRNWDRYCGWQAIVPNRDEAAGQSAADIRAWYGLEAAIVKLDEAGCAVSVRPNGFEFAGDRAVGARKRAVHDVTGAGDQFLAVLGCARASGADWFVAAELANIAAGLQVERHGCVPVTYDELLQELSKENPHDDRFTTSDSAKLVSA